MGLYRKLVLPRFLNSVMGSTELKKFRPEVVSAASGAVLEIGVGPGYNISLYKNISKLYALEPSQELINIAKRRATGLLFPIEFLEASAEHIPLPESSVDTVVSTWTLCSVTQPKKSLNEVLRVLRPGGLFVFIDHGASSNLFIRAIQKILTPFTKHFTGNCHMDRDIKKLILDAGFTISNSKEFSQRLFKPLIYNTQGVAVASKPTRPDCALSVLQWSGSTPSATGPAGSPRAPLPSNVDIPYSAILAEWCTYLLNLLQGRPHGLPCSF